MVARRPTLEGDFGEAGEAAADFEVVEAAATTKDGLVEDEILEDDVVAPARTAAAATAVLDDFAVDDDTFADDELDLTTAGRLRIDRSDM